MKKISIIIVSVILGLLTTLSCAKDEAVTIDANDENPLAWTNSEVEFIMAADSTEKMRIFTVYDVVDGEHVTDVQDSLVLRDENKDIVADSLDETLIHLVRRMYYTVIDPEDGGVGLAGPQVGVNRNIIWVQRQDLPGDPFQCCINPVITMFSTGENRKLEGCLSIPDAHGYVYRANAIILEYDNLKGEHVEELIEGYTARIFQHEIDHLKGVLYTDYSNEIK